MPVINPLSAIKRSLYKKKIGSAPEDLVYLGDQDEEVQITLIKYDEQTAENIEIKNIVDLKEKFEPDKINWINLDGVGNRGMMKELAEYFKFNDLMTSDIMNTEHHPKTEDFEGQLFTTIKMVWMTKENDDIEIIHEHLSLVLGENYLISFQDKVEGDVFSSVRERIVLNKGKIRQKGVDFLYYILLDNIVDQFFIVMEYIREQIEDLEDLILTNPSQNMNEKFSDLRRKISQLRRIIYMMNVAVQHIGTEGSNYIREDTKMYFKDVLDHTKHLNAAFESFRDYINSIMDIYMSNLSNNLNVIMKTLTIFSLFFVPLTFLAGIYGMNFEFMPELHQRWGYPAILGLMLIVVSIMYVFLKRKKWL
jgi:magnesium transporter